MAPIPRNNSFWKKAGVVEVYYLEEKPEIDEGPFLTEERFLIKAIAERLGHIVEKKRAEETLQKAYGELEKRVQERTEALKKVHGQLLHAEKLSAIGNLSASIAHEFNNPLQGIMNILKGVARRATLDEDDAQLMTMAVKECNRMRDLIKSLQQFNRPTSGRKTPIDIHAALDGMLLLGKKVHKEKKISIEKRYAGNMPLIKAVADQIKQVFLNLLNNATDACNEGGTITVATECWKKRSLFGFMIREQVLSLKIKIISLIRFSPPNQR